MMKQYRRIKREHQGEVLFFRLGDFYEMFFEDALEISALLNLTLTTRHGQPMCGLPYHASRSYIARLLKAGKKIAICEQISEPGKGLIDRKVVEVITPGTTIDEDFLDKGNANYLACLAGSQAFLSFAYIDLSAGDFFATSFSAADAPAKLRQELERIQPKEIIVQESLLGDEPGLAKALEERGNLVINRWADWLFDSTRSLERLERQFTPTRLKGFGLVPSSPEIAASGALLDYLDDTARSLLPHVRALKTYGDSDFTGIDESTQRNLELVKNLTDGESRFSLFEVMDETRTAMGRRLLRYRILHPLRDEGMINTRLDMVESLYHHQEKLSKLRELLARTPDLPRLCSRLAMDKAHGKDMVAVKNALFSFHKIGEEYADIERHFVFESPEAVGLDARGFRVLEETRKLVDEGITEDPSIVLSEGNLIRSGFSKELDRLKNLRDSGRKLLEDYLEKERQLTGITGLKIKYNRLIGYYFEVTNVNLSKVPLRFIRRQGVAGGERYTTDRLAELESEINGASDRVIDLERKLFLQIRDKVKTALPEMISAGKRVAELDAAQSLARAATVHGWVRPVINGFRRTVIKEGRHPVVEAHLARGEFIPNDLVLDAGDAGRPEDEAARDEPEPEDGGAPPPENSEERATRRAVQRPVSFALITGPNMAGKSTYLRQAALITIMAQAGSFVSASEAVIGIVDRVYCRVGASDNLARGESTFLVEMNETAYILHTATAQSLVIMDEVGRGTGTEDGLSIAWAVCEELLNTIKCRTLFATHYHELSGIEHPRMANRSMDVTERDGEIVFLRKLREGAAAKSYGLHVASLAGLPQTVVARAAEIMAVFSGRGQKKPPLVSRASAAPEHTPPGFPLPDGKGAKVLENLSNLDINSITPIEALNLIHHWQKLVHHPCAAPHGKTGESRRKKPPPAPGGGPSLFD